MKIRKKSTNINPPVLKHASVREQTCETLVRLFLDLRKLKVQLRANFSYKIQPDLMEEEK